MDDWSWVNLFQIYTDSHIIIKIFYLSTHAPIEMLSSPIYFTCWVVYLIQLINENHPIWFCPPLFSAKKMQPSCYCVPRNFCGYCTYFLQVLQLIWNLLHENLCTSYLLWGIHIPGMLAKSVAHFQYYNGCGSLVLCCYLHFPVVPSKYKQSRFCLGGLEQIKHQATMIHEM